jgi:F-type H+-transporting ATPase subunit b
VAAFTNTLVLGAAKSDSGGSFLVSPGLGLMIWTLIAFGATFLILRKYAYPLISEALEKRRRQIEESIEYAAQMRQEADKLLEEYRARLKEAREQADDILVRSRKAAEAYEQEAKEKSRHEHQEALERTRREIEAETRRALDEIRKEVANLTIIATEKVARKTLDSDDQKRLIEEALAEVDFSAFASEGDGRNN